MLYYFSQQKGIPLPGRSDDLYPMLAVRYFGVTAGIFFLLGILSASYSSADSALTFIGLLLLGQKTETIK